MTGHGTDAGSADARLRAHDHADAGSVWVGQGHRPEDGAHHVLPCAEAFEQEKIKTATIYSGYLTDARPNVITTWTGGVLAKVTSYSVGTRRYTPTNGSYRMEYVQAETPDGAQWYGSKSDGMDCITLRRRVTR